jgi:hypothetical protein
LQHGEVNTNGEYKDSQSFYTTFKGRKQLFHNISPGFDRPLSELFQVNIIVQVFEGFPLPPAQLPGSVWCPECWNLDNQISNSVA